MTIKSTAQRKLVMAQEWMKPIVLKRLHARNHAKTT